MSFDWSTQKLDSFMCTSFNEINPVVSALHIPEMHYKVRCTIIYPKLIEVGV